ncbi:MAG: autotransporter outer membrane beta-barrel domain-containing protein, partial [Cyanobacteriota bacterium]|nr:autotransporter outer membrane beta-barrel domain-containing protein [Cyanobacteriota bacterium]
DAPGRSLFNYNNLLVDTVFERLPLRQFEPVELSAVVDEEAVMEEPLPAGEPVRGLWSHQPWMQNEQAEAFVGQQLAQAEVLEDVSIEMAIEGVGVVEDPSLTAQYANREGVRAWYRGFGGDLGPTSTSTLYGDYNASASGMVLGADVSIGSNVQIGAFANYGDVSLYQFAGKTGSGAWNPTGWGGGITADWWTDNVYVQGLISASSFSGSQSRNIIAINEQLGDETARGEKNVTSYAYALRLGAPFQTGRLLLEPQFTAAWTQNQESGFRENGADQLNLRYGSRTTNFLQTELGMKLALPIQSGERGEWVPNLRVAWLGDWDMNNEDQTIGYAFTDKTVGVAPLEEDQSGVLLEAGLDYTMANINSGSWKLYVRGGAEVWGGERGTDWRASGGMTWQF